MFKKAILCVVLMGMFIGLGACKSAQPREQALTGDQQHERNDTGFDSQSVDY